MEKEAMEAAIEKLTEAVGDLNKILLGNGKIGMVSKVEIMWKIRVFMLIGVGGTIGSIITYLATTGRP